jgi:exopolyphosphatase/guanosine-5'-triphosphate,3'-diphosphate pyrophosphatase
MMKYIAGIDIGTNSVLYSLFEVKGSKIAKDLYFERHSPRIGSKLAKTDRPLITDTSYINLKKIIEKNIRHASKAGSEKILIAATNPFRLAQNGEEVKNRLEEELGCEIAILKPEREAYLSFLGAAGYIGENQTAVVIDMGGGST